MTYLKLSARFLLRAWIQFDIPTTYNYNCKKADMINVNKSDLSIFKSLADVKWTWMISLSIKKVEKIIIKYLCISYLSFLLLNLLVHLLASLLAASITIEKVIIFSIQYSITQWPFNSKTSLFLCFKRNLFYMELLAFQVYR